MPFLFTNPWILAGLTALGIPVLIHLLLKRKIKRLRFSTIQFFQRQHEQSSRRRRVRNWLLLTLRLLIVALLVLGFARPFLRQNTASAGGGRIEQAVFILDRSASMLAASPDGLRWTLAKDRIRKVLNGLGRDDRAALIACADHADLISGFDSPLVVAKVLNDLEPTYGTGSLREGLQQALKLVSTAGPDLHSTIYLASDFQKNGCRNLPALPEQLEVKLLPVGDLHCPNLSVTQLELDNKSAASPQAVIANFSDEEAPSVRFEFSLDDQIAGSTTLTLQPGASTNLQLSLPPLKPGWHQARASVQSRDAFQVDNARYASFFVPEPARVVIVQPRTDKRIFEQETFFLVSALDPLGRSSGGVISGFKVDRVAPEDLVSLLGRAGEGSTCDVVILPGLKDLPPGMGSALTAFVRRGGGLLLFLGEGVSANRYNSEFRDLLPVQPSVPELNPDLGGWRIAHYNTNHPAFAAFRLPNSGDLRIPEFTRRFSLAGAESASRLAFFDDGVALLAIKTVGSGQVALVNSSADTTWNDWPKHKTFVPWMHGLTKALARKNETIPAAESNNCVAALEPEIEVGSVGKRMTFSVRGLDGKDFSLTSDESGRLRDRRFGAPGLYSLRDSAGKEFRRFAVNLPLEESDLDALRPKDFQQQLARVADSNPATSVSGFFGVQDTRKQLWTALLLIALLLLLVEPLIANRTTA